MLTDTEQLRHDRETRVERVRAAHALRKSLERAGIATPCPFELARGKDLPERVSVRHRYWAAVQIVDEEDFREALQRTVR